MENNHNDGAHTVSVNLGSVLNLEKHRRKRDQPFFRILYMGTKKKMLYAFNLNKWSVYKA